MAEVNPDMINGLANQFMDNMVATSNEDTIERPSFVSDAEWRTMGSMLVMANQCMTIYVGVAVDAYTKANTNGKPTIGPEAFRTTGEATDLGSE